MIRHHLLRACLFLSAGVSYCLALVGPLIERPIMSFIRDAPAATGFLFRLPAHVIAYITIAILKPVYRESYETHGLSLTSVRT